jgi:hypothetical protein
VGQLDFRRDNGEISVVQIELAGTGTRRVRIANLPPKLSDRAIRETLSNYGEVKEIREKTCSKLFKYPVSDGIRVAITCLKSHIPSHPVIAGLRALISYEGQPSTCYGRNSVDHQYHDCQSRKIRETQQPQHYRSSWADIVKQDAIRQQPAVVRSQTIAMEGVFPVNTHKIQHKPPTPDAGKVGK